MKSPVLNWRAWLLILIIATTGCAGRQTASVDAFRQFLRVGEVPSAGHLVATFFEVGLGDAILLEFPSGSVMLVDAGVGWHAEFILNYCEARGIVGLDALLLTHPHLDHYGGMKAVLEHLPVRQFFHNGEEDSSSSYQELTERLRESAIPSHVLRRGDDLNRVAGEGVSVEVLYPDEEAFSFTSDPNDSTIVLRVTHGDVSILLTGDAEKAEEKRLLEMEPGRLSAQVLKLGHHGSVLSGTSEFLQAVDPEVAVVQGTQYADIHPVYPRPSYHLRAEFSRRDVPLLKTKHEGTVQVISDGRSIRWHTMARDLEEVDLARGHRGAFSSQSRLDSARGS